MPSFTTTREAIAHTAPDGRVHRLEEHLRAVGRLAGQFASKWDARSWGELAGLWHDLGKYSMDFQAYIRGEGGAEAHIEGGGRRVDHSSAGALHAVSRFGQTGRVLAYVIAGHHAGLADWANEGTGTTPLSLRLAPNRQGLLRAQAI
jgi:CRISPR-associated endonuclease/helicase Cas3